MYLVIDGPVTVLIQWNISGRFHRNRSTSAAGVFGCMGVI